jgi:hypothetical protein
MSTWNEPASLIVVFSSLLRFCRIMVLSAHDVEEGVASHDSAEERTRERKEIISNGLIVKEWAVESTEGDQGTPPPGEIVGAPQPPAPVINSYPASFVSLDCESLEFGEDEGETAGCAICLSSFKPQQLVCESNNTSCRHFFHRDCMVDWLMKHHDNCPLCREAYLAKTVY